MRKNESLAEFVIRVMTEEGFEASDFKGKPGHEVVTFKNSQGETRTARFGFTPVKPKNYKISIKADKNKTRDTYSNQPDVYCCKADFSKFYPKGGLQ